MGWLTATASTQLCASYRQHKHVHSEDKLCCLYLCLSRIDCVHNQVHFPCPASSPLSPSLSRDESAMQVDPSVQKLYDYIRERGTIIPINVGFLSTCAPVLLALFVNIPANRAIICVCRNTIRNYSRLEMSRDMFSSQSGMAAKSGNIW